MQARGRYFRGGLSSGRACSRSPARPELWGWGPRAEELGSEQSPCLQLHAAPPQPEGGPQVHTGSRCISAYKPSTPPMGLRRQRLCWLVSSLPFSELLGCLVSCSPGPPACAFPRLGLPPSLHRADPSVSSQALGALSSSGKPFLDLTRGRPPLFMACMAPSFAVSRPELRQSRCPPRALLGAWGPAADALRGARKRTDTLPGHLSPLPSFLLWARHPTCSSGAKFISPWETCTSQF